MFLLTLKSEVGHRRCHTKTLRRVIRHNRERERNSPGYVTPFSLTHDQKSKTYFSEHLKKENFGPFDSTRIRVRSDDLLLSFKRVSMVGSTIGRLLFYTSIPVEF